MKSLRTVIGIHSTLEALKVRPQKVVQMWIKKEAEKSAHQYEEALSIAKKNKIKVQFIHSQQLDRWGRGHQGIAVEVNETPQIDWKKLSQKSRVVLLALDGLEDPQNLGAIFRTAWLMGVDGLIISETRSVGLTPTVSKVASGGVEHLPVEFCSQLAPKLSDLKEEGYWVYGLHHESPKEVSEVIFAEKTVLILGAEGQGLRGGTKKVCDELVRLPQVDAHASYNVSVAGAMITYEVCRQKK